MNGICSEGFCRDCGEAQAVIWPDSNGEVFGFCWFGMQRQVENNGIVTTEAVRFDFYQAQQK